MNLGKFGFHGSHGNSKQGLLYLLSAPISREDASKNGCHVKKNPALVSADDPSKGGSCGMDPNSAIESITGWWMLVVWNMSFMTFHMLGIILLPFD